jgi:hypothetical protein
MTGPDEPGATGPEPGPPHGAGETPDSPDPQSGTAGANGTPYATTMLRRLRPPEHGAAFWSDLDARLADEPQLRLAPRAAIRPITQPPPVIDDRNLASSLAAAESARPRRTSSRRLVIGCIVATLVVLVVLAAIGSPDETKTAGPDATTNTSAGRAPTSGGGPATTAPPPTVAPGRVDPGATLQPAGVGPLRIGSTLGQLQASGVALQPDESTFRGSRGKCYNALVTGALDLRLRFVPPPGQRRAEDPTQGVLAAIDVRSERPSTRLSDTGIGLGANQLQVLAAYAGNLDQRDDPFIPGGKIFRAAAGGGLGIAYDTDGQNVIGIAVGNFDIIRFRNNCG